MDLSHVLWIGGPPGAGKTTVARQLARRRGLRWYNSDTKTWEHRDRALAAGVRLPERGPGHEHFDRRPMILDDLHALPRSPLVLADGPLTPDLVESRPHIAGRAVWLMPSRDVQRAWLRARHPGGVPPAYLARWELFAERLRRSRIPTIDVDHLTVAETIDEVERAFAAYLAEGPTAVGLAERRGLLRYGNQAIVAQCTSPSARPRVVVDDPGSVVRTFDCECAAPSCDALVDLRVADAAAAVQEAPPAIVAAGH